MDWSKEKLTDQVNLFAKPRLILRSPWKFSKHGQCGMDVSELLPNLATCVDDLSFVKSVVTENGNHPAATFLMNTGLVLPGRPSVGAWVTYGLGSENKNLPGFVVLPDYRALPFSGSQQWGPGFLPASYQGTMMQWKGDPVNDLRPPSELTSEDVNAQMELLRSYNHAYLEKNFTNPDLQGRIDAYELAYRMQTEVPGVLNTEKRERRNKGDVRSGRGRHEVVRNALPDGSPACRKGVRFVQLYTPSQSWDSHTGLLKGHAKNAKEVDKPIAALIKDLKQRGLLDSTLDRVDGRVRPHARQSCRNAEERRPRPQHQSHDDVLCRRRHQAGGKVGETDDWHGKRSKHLPDAGCPCDHSAPDGLE